MTKAVIFSFAPSSILALALPLGLAIPGTAAAQSAPSDASCPPGSWFCAQPSPEPSPTVQKSAKPLEPLPDPEEGEPEAPPPQPVRRRAPLPPPPPVVMYPPESPSMEERPEEPPPYVYRARLRPLSPPHEWGLNLHLDGATLGRGTGASSAGLGGAGAGLRFKPNRRVGIEADLDFLGGTDYQGDRRSETAFSLNGLLYLNPLSRAQVYLLAGFGWSGAHVTCDPTTMTCPNGNLDAQYSYFGGQIGAGLEIRLSRLFALNGDVRGFVRTRTDDKAQSQPEFVDAYGRTTNTSGGALFTGGMTLYF